MSWTSAGSGAGFPPRSDRSARRLPAKVRVPSVHSAGGGLRRVNAGCDRTHDRPGKGLSMRTPLPVEIAVEGTATLKSGQEILSLARETKFKERNRLEDRHGRDSSITYVPRDYIPEPLGTAAVQGLLLCKLIVKGQAPQGVNLVPGTYYYFVQLVDRRWIGFAVSTVGAVACTTLGIMASQTFTVHPDKPHTLGPQVTIHPISSPKERRRVSALAVEYWWEWTMWEGKMGEGSAGCKTTKWCNPARR
jgi:hypothetical protein